ncbi:rRNA-binding ribosome biosynthesis protein rpf2 [Pichia californica]|uniref:Ribosome production factor 2 homolog n=1 Tax=Pichia californica TaxID=460514 RepID=A0A9P7BGU5_9ASCO|nr:rRNA-binding ribosome biosynthesis protein rpf2 [[Candida] californica]KAG0690496.1 rRNA-binding ribosome biosynthesis protein rpf2 [[Candida] californica]
MIRSTKPKNNRAKRAIEKKESKIVENVKSALFIPGNSSNQALHDITVDLSSLKKPYIKRFTKKNSILPFEDTTSLEFLSEKNDSSILILSTNNKKRPNNLTFIRTFDYKIYDMIELNVLSDFKLFQDFKKMTFQVGLRPLFSFQGHIFDINPTFIQIKSLFLDMFHGENSTLQDVAGLQYVISVSAIEEDDNDTAISKLPLVYFRVYKLKTLKSNEPKLARIELEETGPRLNFKIGRVQHVDPEMEKEALKVPKQLQSKERKNVQTDASGDQVAKIHVGIQDLSRLQTRKMKGLKSKFDQNNSDDEEVEDDFVDAISDNDQDEEEIDDDIEDGDNHDEKEEEEGQGNNHVSKKRKL